MRNLILEMLAELYELSDKIKRQQDKEGHSHNRGSKHFIYTNRAYYGLYNILSLLGAKVKIRKNLGFKLQYTI